WGLLLIVIGLGSFILPLFNMQFQLINLTGGDPKTSGVLFIIAGAVLYLIGQAAEGRARPAPRPAAAVPPAQVAAPGRPVQPPPPAPPTAGPTFCGNCGTRLTRPVKFCTACGAPIQ